MVEAYLSDGTPLVASAFPAAEWDALKAISVSAPEMFKMACCNARAVLKTSLYGVQFFAHYSDECATAPETVWHVSAKDNLLMALTRLGVQGRLEVAGGAKSTPWRADVLIEHGDRRIAVEMQRSYLHYRDFLRRQERYRANGVECYWLLREPVSRPLAMSIIRKRLKEEFAGRLPPGGFFPQLPTFYWGVLDFDPVPTVRGPALSAHLETWTRSVLDGRLAYVEDERGHWRINNMTS